MDGSSSRVWENTGNSRHPERSVTLSDSKNRFVSRLSSIFSLLCVFFVFFAILVVQNSEPLYPSGPSSRLHR